MFHGQVVSRDNILLVDKGNRRYQTRTLFCKTCFLNRILRYARFNLMGKLQLVTWLIWSIDSSIEQNSTLKKKFYRIVSRTVILLIQVFSSREIMKTLWRTGVKPTPTAFGSVANWPASTQRRRTKSFMRPWSNTITICSSDYLFWSQASSALLWSEGH